MNIKPPPLPEGGTIGIIAPSSPAKRNLLKKGIEYLQSKGYKIKISKYLTRGKYNMAGPDDSTRAKIFEEFMLDDDTDCIICARGGYGALRIVDKINYDKLKNAKPKPLVGYSDITALQLALLRKLKWISFSGPMVATDLSMNIDSYTENWFWNMLTGDKLLVEVRNPENMKLNVINHGEAEGIILPVCLSVFISFLNTEYCPSLDNSILILEDINEKGYKLDRLFQTLKHNKIFNKTRGNYFRSIQQLLFKKNHKIGRNNKRSHTLSRISDNIKPCIRSYKEKNYFTGGYES